MTSRIFGSIVALVLACSSATAADIRRVVTALEDISFHLEHATTPIEHADHRGVHSVAAQDDVRICLEAGNRDAAPAPDPKQRPTNCARHRLR